MGEKREAHALIATTVEGRGIGQVFRKVGGSIDVANSGYRINHYQL